MRATLFALLLSAGCATVGDKFLTTELVVSSTLIAVDYCSTIDASGGGRWNRTFNGGRMLEINPLLGHTPSIQTLGLVATGDVILNTGVRVAPMPNRLKHVWYGALILIESAVIIDNYSQDAKCR